MLKYVDVLVGFQEIPDEISLCINISNCPCHCEGCHSSYLAEDIGRILTIGPLFDLIEDNKGISCVSFMGGDSDPERINGLAWAIKKKYPNLKVAWYSGRQELSNNVNLENFDYIKLGPYKEEFGPLNSKTTNQTMIKIDHLPGKTDITDITYKFWKNDQNRD